MSDPRLDHPPLKECLDTLNYLFIDIVRLTYEQGYEKIMGGYCELKVATLDSGKCTSKLVAAKKLRLGVQSLDPKRLAFRLARELKVWAGLRHPHVLPLLGFHLGNGYKEALLISEYMEHGDLKDFIAKTRPSRNERLYLVRDLTDGLAYLHTQNAPIRHGDLKPGNVLVNSDRRALLADFGLSKTLGTGPTGFTTGNDARYTIRYSSPEVLLEGGAAESLPNDIWSWGCLVVEALTDEIPFANIKLDAQLMLAIVRGTFPSDVANLSSYTQEFKVLLANCWSRQPSQRPTAVDCLRAVESALPSQPTPSVPSPSVPTRMADMSCPIIPNDFNFGIPTQHHNPNQPQHHPPGVSSTPNGTLRNEQRQTFYDPVLHSQQRNQNAFAALSRAKPDTRIFQGPNAPPNGPQQQQQSQPGVPGLPGLGLASGGVGNGGGGGGPVEALQNQNQNSLLQLAAQHLGGLTPQQLANMNPQQREQSRALIENQQQQPPLGSQIPGLGQMGQSSTGFSNGQQQPPAQGPPQSNAMDGAAFQEQFVKLPLEAFSNQVVNFRAKIKALEEQRDRLLQIKTPQMIEQAQRIQAQLNGLQNVMWQLAGAYPRHQAIRLQQAAAGGPSGQQGGGQPQNMGGQGGSNPLHNRPGMPQGPQDALAGQHGLPWSPANLTPQIAQQLGRERLQAMVNAHERQQQQQASQQPQQLQNQLQFNPGQGQQPPPPLGFQNPGLGQMKQSAQMEIPSLSQTQISGVPPEIGTAKRKRIDEDSVKQSAGPPRKYKRVRSTNQDN